MSTTNAATDATTTTGHEVRPTQKVKRFFSIGLHGVDGAMLRITASLKKDGTATSYATHATKGPGGKRQSKRGATEKHEDMAHAKAAVEKLAASAIKLGWARGKASGFATKPDAFTATNLPAPGPASKSGSKK